MAGMRTHFFPPACGFLGEQPAARRGHRGSSCHLWPCEIGQQNSPDAAPYLPILLGFSTDQSFTVWQGHPLPSPAAQHLGRLLCSRGCAPTVECSAQPGGGCHLSRETQSSILGSSSGNASGAETQLAAGEKAQQHSAVGNHPSQTHQSSLKEPAFQDEHLGFAVGMGKYLGQDVCTQKVHIPRSSGWDHCA